MESLKQKLKSKIIDTAYLSKGDVQKINPWYTMDYIFDLRLISMRGDILNTIGEIFTILFKKNFPFQIGGLESSAIPLIAGISQYLSGVGTNVNCFYIRKSRKKYDLSKDIEGSFDKEIPVILIDDIINTGSGLLKAVEIIELKGGKVSKIFTLLRFRNLDDYRQITDKDIEIISLFCLDDLSDKLPVKNVTTKLNIAPFSSLKIKWTFKSANPNFFHVIPKSSPITDSTNIYFGSDQGVFWAINKITGNIIWQYKVSFGVNGKYIFSSPIIFGESVIFGAYDGNVYALNRQTGKRMWVFMEADWIGSSPTVSLSNNLVFIGIENGLPQKKGGLVALNGETGEKVWKAEFPDLTHASPAYSTCNDIVVCGSNDGYMTACDAKDGEILWKFKTKDAIRASSTFDSKEEIVYFGSFDKNVYAINLITGRSLWEFETLESIYSTPLYYQNNLFIASLDKNLYCLDSSNGKMLWKKNLGSRIFSEPVIINDSLYIGNNAGNLFRINPNNGEIWNQWIFTERIVNKIFYDEIVGLTYVPTVANELYCIEKGLI